MGLIVSGIYSIGMHGTLNIGASGHLARAIEWHSIGSRFDPDQLH